MARMQELLDAVASPTRREIIRLVWDQERTAGDIASHFSVSWPAVSQSLRRLRETGLVNERREGTRRYYSADRSALQPLQSVLEQMWGSDLARLKEVVERER